MNGELVNTALFRTLFSKSIHAACLTDSQFTVQFTNAAFSSLFHISSSIQGKSLWEVLSDCGLNPEDIPQHHLFTEQTTSGHSLSGKLRLNPSSSPKQKIDFTSHVLGSGDQIWYHFEFSDVTDQVETRNILRATMSSLQLATDISSLGVFDFDFRKKKWLLNPRMYQIFGFQLGQFDNTQDAFNQLIHPEDFPMVFTEWSERKTQGGKLDISFRIIHPTEGIKYVKTIGECLRDTRNEPWRFVGTIQDISDQILKERNLADERNLLQSITDSQNRFILRLQHNGQINFANKPFIHSLQLKESDLIGSNFIDLIVPDDAKAFLSHIIHSRNPWLVEKISCRLKRADGSSMLIEWEIMAVSNKSNTHKELQLIGKDITVEKELSNEIELAYGNIRSLINNFSKVSIWSVDRELKLIAFNDYFSKEYEKFWGRPVSSGDAIYENTNADEAANKFWRAQFQRALDGERFILEYEINGMYFEVSMNPILINKEITGVACYGMDVTPTKLSERKLRLSEERWKFAVEGNKYGIWDWDVIVDQLYFSPSCYEMLGYNQEDYLHKKIDDWAIEIHPNDLKAINETAEKMRSGELDSFNVEMRFKCKDGSYKWIANRGKTFKRNEENKPLRILGLWTDISKHKADEAKIQDYVESLEKFATITSHELRHPVAKIMGLSGRLKDPEIPESERLQLIHNLALTAEELDAVILEMSQSVRTEKNKQELSPAQKSPKTLNHKCVWFIDDDIINNLLNERLLKKHFPGITCKTFSDPEIALSTLLESLEDAPDALFLDINMPVMNGWDFLDHLANRNIHLQVYMLTSSIDPKDQEKAMAYSDVHDFISKPLKEDRLRTILG